MGHTASTILALGTVAAFAASSSGDLTVFETEDRDAWFAAVGDVTTIGFVFDEAVVVTDQYADLGIIFPDEDDVALEMCNAFPNDCWGLKGFIFQASPIHFVLDKPGNWVAADYPGYVRFELYSGGQFIGMSEYLGHSGDGNFSGVVSDVPFDEVFITRFDLTPFIDDLHFGGVSADFDDDGEIGPFDLAFILGNWGACTEKGVFCPSDLNLDGTVGPADLAIVLGGWGLVE